MSRARSARASNLSIEKSRCGREGRGGRVWNPSSVGRGGGSTTVSAGGANLNLLSPWVLYFPSFFSLDGCRQLPIGEKAAAQKVEDIAPSALRSSSICCYVSQLMAGGLTAARDGYECSRRVAPPQSTTKVEAQGRKPRDAIIAVTSCVPRVGLSFAVLFCCATTHPHRLPFLSRSVVFERYGIVYSHVYTLLFRTRRMEAVRGAKHGQRTLPIVHAHTQGNQFSRGKGPTPATAK